MFERELRLYKTVHKIPKRKLPRKTNLVYGNQKKNVKEDDDSSKQKKTSGVYSEGLGSKTHSLEAAVCT